MYTYEPTNDGRYSFKATGGYVFETEQRAQLFCQMWNEHFDAMRRVEPVLSTLSRTEYVEACAHFGVDALTDAECDSYGVRYGEFTPWLDGDKIAGYSPTHCVQMALARRRLRGIEQERKAQPQPRPQPIIETLCDCGHYATHPMSTSAGTSCPDCYDEMSD